MRVLMLSYEYPPAISGGLGSHVYHLGRHLARTGIKLTVLTPWRPGTEYTEKADQVEIVRIPTGNGDFLTTVQDFNQNLLAFDTSGYDLVHAHDWLVAAAALEIGRRLPLVATIHATEYGRNNGLTTPLNRHIHQQETALARGAKQVIVCSRFMQLEVQNLFQVNSTVIANGVELPEPLPATVSAEPTLFFIGRLVHEKGVQTILQALPLIIPYYPEVRLCIAGRGYMEDQLRQQAHGLGVETNVEFAGFLDARTRRQYTANALATLVPSLYEPFGIVALEAMAEARPVIAADVGGLHEIIRHNHDGLLHDPNSAQTLADQVLRLLHDREVAGTLIPTLGRNARLKMEQNYNWNSIAKLTTRLYREALA